MENLLLCKLIMLPAKQSGLAIMEDKKTGETKFYPFKENSDAYLEDKVGDVHILPQHLYLVSDREIKKGDWKYCYHQFQGRVYRHGFEPEHVSGGKKIEATTDNSLTQVVDESMSRSNTVVNQAISQIPQAFVQAFMEANGKIDKVQIEMDREIPFTCTSDGKPTGFYVKTNSDNTVVIHQKEIKVNNKLTESYCSFEVSKLLKEKGFEVFEGNTFYDAYGHEIKFETKAKSYRHLAMTDGKYNDILRPTKALAMQWIRINLNWHFELIWDIINGKQVWFYSLSQIGDVDNDAIDMSPKDSPEETAEEALLYALRAEIVDKSSIKEPDYNYIKDFVLEESGKGNIVIATVENLQITPLDEFVKQPTEGLLYDLNRNEAVVLTLIKDPKWINDYAVVKVIRELKRQIETLQKQLDK